MSLHTDITRSRAFGQAAPERSEIGRFRLRTAAETRLATAVAALLLVCAFVAACDGGSDVRTARGYVVGVESKSLLELNLVRVRTEAGETIELSAKGKLFPGFSPSHLREHMVQGLPVMVSYHREDGELVLDEVRD